MPIQASIQLSSETFGRLASLARDIVQSPQDFVSAAIQQHLGDMEDVIRAEAIAKEVQAGAMKSQTLEEVSRALGLDD